MSGPAGRAPSAPDPSAPVPPAPDPGQPGLDALARLLDLEDLDVDLFRSRDTSEPGNRLFGGQVAAQALVAAERSTDAAAAAHSLHAYFLRPGDTGKHVIFRVDRLQDGRTFRRRRVTAIQDGMPILCLEASFTTDGATTDHQVTAPAAPAPESCPPLGRKFRGSGLQPHQAFDLRAVTTHSGQPFFPDDLWFRPLGALGGSRVSGSAVLTYISDLTLASVTLRPGGRRDVSRLTSLDHVMWFHNEVRLDDWLLYAKSTPASGPVRGLAQGAIFHRDGTLIASVAQEVLAHTARPGTTAAPR
jgi:acyl-CoA thioesterase-2